MLRRKLPPVLQIQVWDADYVMPDDFLGSLQLDLSHFPRGSKTAGQCSLRLLDEDSPRLSLFQQRRVKGWWPFHAKNEDDEMELTVSGQRQATYQLQL